MKSIMASREVKQWYLIRVRMSSKKVCRVGRVDRIISWQASSQKVR
jgi:hypothetical protein